MSPNVCGFIKTPQTLFASLFGCATLLLGSGWLPLNAQTSETRREPLLLAEAASSLEGKAIALLTSLNTQQYAAAHSQASETLLESLTVEAVETFWTDLIAKTGPIQGFGSTRVVETINSDIVIVETDFEQGARDVVVTYDKDGGVLGVNIPGIDSIQKIASSLILNLSQKDYSAARRDLHPFLKTELFSPQIQQKWEAVVNRYGSVESIEKILVLPGVGAQNGSLVQITVEFERATDDILVIFDQNQLITGVDMALQ
ncbi:MAG: DUF3887 domain-containing protein [Cyanobacteria bacterium P01_H01_bin.15]